MLDAATIHGLANPIAFPSHMTPELWLLAALAMVAEIKVASRLLRRLLTTEHTTGMLVLLNAASWVTFLLAVDGLSPSSYPAWRTVACLEGCVVLVEFLVLWLVVCESDTLRPGIRHGVLRIFGVSLVANLVSIVISVVPWILALAAGQ